MKTKPLFKTAAIITVFLTLFLVTATRANAIELVNLLTQNLGVNNAQAMGGAGAIFNYAKDNLSGMDFSKVAAAVPGMDQLLAAAPAADQAPGGLGGLSSSLGGTGLQKLSGIASLAGDFSKLGLGSEMLNNFIPVILSYVESTGGESVRQILETVLK